MQDVTRWLESLGLDKYAEVFAENAVGLDVLHLFANGCLRPIADLRQRSSFAQSDHL